MIVVDYYYVYIHKVLNHCSDFIQSKKHVLSRHLSFNFRPCKIRFDRNEHFEREGKLKRNIFHLFTVKSQIHKIDIVKCNFNCKCISNLGSTL